MGPSDSAVLAAAQCNPTLTRAAESAHLLHPPVDGGALKICFQVQAHPSTQHKQQPPSSPTPAPCARRWWRTCTAPPAPPSAASAPPSPAQQKMRGCPLVLAAKHASQKNGMSNPSAAAALTSPAAACVQAHTRLCHVGESSRKQQLLALPQAAQLQRSPSNPYLVCPVPPNQHQPPYSKPPHLLAHRLLLLPFRHVPLVDGREVAPGEGPGKGSLNWATRAEQAVSRPGAGTRLPCGSHACHLQCINMHAICL